MRCVHEASLYDENCFITLTFDEEHLPKSGSVSPSDFQKFMKRLRKKFPGRKIRYYHCGEYGEESERPHYHAALFNFDFPDKELIKVSDGNRLYRSPLLESLWPFGISSIGSLTFESAAYVARYITKKVYGEKAEDHYRGRHPEYTTMSKGIGKDFCHKFMDEIFPDDFVVVRGKKMGVPKYYEQFLDEKELNDIKRKRKFKAYDHSENNTAARLYVRDKVNEAKFNLKKRSFENGDS